MGHVFYLNKAGNKHDKDDVQNSGEGALCWYGGELFVAAGTI